MYRYLLLLSLIAISTLSCKRRACISYGVQGILVSASSSVTLTDTMMKVVRYPKNGSFQNPVDSFQQGYDYQPVGSMTVQFAASSFSNYDYDLLCTVYPSGKTYQVTKITHEDGKSDKPGFSCVNPVHYFVNGTETVMPGYIGMQGFVLNITY